jgi:hypothetical protein
MEKAHDQKPAVVSQRDLETSPASHYQVSLDHLPLDNGDVADSEAAHGDNTGSILIAVRKMEQQILEGVNTQSGERTRQGISDSLELGDRDVIQ